jgi:hypothetical protein
MEKDFGDFDILKDPANKFTRSEKYKSEQAKMRKPAAATSPEQRKKIPTCGKVAIRLSLLGIFT